MFDFGQYFWNGFTDDLRLEFRLMEPIRIKFNRPKLMIFGAISGGFVLLGYGMINSGIVQVYSFDWIMLLSGILFFGAGTLVGFSYAFARGVGLVIDDKGITDSSSLTSVGLVKWKDIKGFKSSSFMGAGWIIVYVRNPEYYVKSIKNGLTRGAVKLTLQLYGSPISIGVAQLAIDPDKLGRLLVEELERSRKRGA